MSLISEGLKKAHLETLRQDREQRRQYFSPVRSHVPSGGTKRGVLIVAALTGAILASAATAAWITRSLNGSETAVRAETSGNAAVPTHVPPSTMIVPEIEKPLTVTAGKVADSRQNAVEVPVERDVGSRPVPTEAPAIDAAPIPRPRTGPAPAAVSARRVSAAVPDAPSLRSESPARSGVKMREGLEEGKNYTSPLRTRSAGEVRLSGISSTNSKSLAIINGNVVMEGETVGPFVVEKIDRGRVKLRYIDVRFWLSY